MPTSPPLDINGNPVFDVQLQALSEGRDGNGVAGQTDLEVSDGANANESAVAPGTAYYDGASGTLASSTTVTHSTGDATDDRWDLIAFDVSTGSVVLREGTPDPTPSPPDLQADEVLLAVVYVAAGQTDFGASAIVNFRVLGGSETSAADDGTTVVDRLTEIDATDGVAISDGGAGTATIAADPGNALEIASGQLAVASAAIDTAELASGAVTDAEVSSSTTIARSKLDDERATTGPHTANVTTSGEEVLLVDTSGGAVTVTLASSDVSEGNVVTVVDVGGAAESNAITVDTEGSESIDGGTSELIETNYGATVVASDGTDWYTAGGGGGGGAALIVSDNGTAVEDPTETLDVDESLTASGDGNGTATVGLDHDRLFQGATGASGLANGNQLLVQRTTIADGETLAVYEASLTKGAAQASSTGMDLDLVTFDGAGGFTAQATLIAGDGATVFADESGSPLGSYTNASGGAQEVGVIANNGSGASEDVAAHAEGRVE